MIINIVVSEDVREERIKDKKIERYRGLCSELEKLERIGCSVEPLVGVDYFQTACFLHDIA